MQSFNVINTIQIGNTTSVLVHGRGTPFKNGIIVSDTKGEIYKVIAVGMSGSVLDVNNALDKTSLLVEGSFSSNKMYV